MDRQGPLLHINTIRPSSPGLEAHLASIQQAIAKIKPRVVVMDPISVFMSAVERDSMKSMLTRLVDFLKMEQITALFTHLSSDANHLEGTEQRVSSIMDSWLLLRDQEHKDQRKTSLCILKSRGMAHSRKMLDFIMTGDGIRLGSDHAPGKEFSATQGSRALLPSAEAKVG